MLRKILMWLAVAFVAFYVFTQPHAAGHLVGDTIDGLKTAANSLATFIDSI